MIEPYKRRAIRPDEDMWVYRNLMRTDGVWYSVMQRGLVVAHVTAICLRDVRLVVREGGRRRVIESGVKNVHAFAVGRLVLGWDHASIHGAVRARYIPRDCATFEARNPWTGEWFAITSARMAHLGTAGLQVLV